MRTVSYTFWRDEDYFLGFLNEYPDYWTEGTSKEDLLENLRDLLTDFESGEVPFVRKVEEMAV
jgi:predicted RNase H-like HicB family nuclease